MDYTSFSWNKTPLYLLGPKMVNVGERKPEQQKTLVFLVIDTWHFPPYSSGQFLEHHSVFVYILDHGSFAWNTTALYL